MTALVLLASTWAAGASAGPGVVDEAPALLLTPWGGFEAGDFEVALQAPVRFELAETRLRSEDHDEVADLARLVRHARYGEALGVGALVDVTFGRGTIVRRYHNGTDDDTPRLGALFVLEDEALAGLVFVDQLLGRPVVGARVEVRPTAGLALGITGAADTQAPAEEDGVEVGFGADARVQLGEALGAHLDVNGLDDADPGVHLGLDGAWRPGDWTVDVLAEGMWLGAGYEWARFDLGYLVDRWRRPAPGESAFGGRGALELGYARALVVGAEYADADRPESADLSVWLRVPDERVQVVGLWRARAARAELIDPGEAIAAFSVRVPVAPAWALSLNLARTWRSGSGALRPGTDAALMVDWTATP